MSDLSTRRRIRPALILVVVMIGVVALGLLALPSAKRANLPQWPGVIVYDDPRGLEPFELTDHKGAKFDNKRFKNHWTFLFFGYTHCPDVCPATLGAMKNIRKALISEPQQIPLQFVFVTVDPHRDTQSVMAEHIQFYDPEFIGLTAADSATIDKLAQQFGVIYDYENPVDGGRITDPSSLPPETEYLVNHYASIFLVGPDGRAWADILPPHQVERVKEIFNTLSSL